MTEIGNRKERLRVREAGASAAGRGQRPYASFPDRQPNVTPAHQKNVVSEQNAKHSAIETGSNRKSMSERPTQPQSGSEAKPDDGFPQFFRLNAKDSNSAFFQQYLRKMQLLPLENPLSDEKDSKSVKKRLKKGLTRGQNRDIITELSARATNSPDGTDP